MKQLKFNPDLVPLVLNGTKTVTWRLFDDKDLSIGDELEFINSLNGQKFATAQIVNLTEKLLSEIDVDDRTGHEPVGEGDELLKHYEILYKRPVSPHELIKIIKFKLI